MNTQFIDILKTTIANANATDQESFNFMTCVGEQVVREIDELIANQNKDDSE